MKKLFKSKLSVFLFLLTFLVTQCFFVFNTRTTSSLDNDGNSNSTEDVSVTVLESDSHHTVVKFDINNFSKDLVNINNKSYYNINCEGTSLPLEEGAPELPRICRNIVIPNDAL